MRIAVLGIDLGKNSCGIVGLDATGRVVLRRRPHRDGVVELAAGLPGCVIAMEACWPFHPAAPDGTFGQLRPSRPRSRRGSPRPTGPAVLGQR
jgi:hypothetical protein